MKVLNPITAVVMKQIFQRWLRRYKKILEAWPTAEEKPVTDGAAAAE